MTRAQPEQPQGQPYPSSSAASPYGYPMGGAAGRSDGTPGYPAPVTSPAEADTAAIPRDGGTAGYSVDAGHSGAGATGGADGLAPVGSGPADSATAGPGPTAQTRKHSRVGAAWVAVVIAAIVLIFLLIFILQNSDQVQVQYLGWEGTLSLGVAMMFAALAGALTVGLLGTVRILQLRKRAKRAGG